MSGTTALSAVICLHSLPGYHPWILAYDIAIFKNAVLTMLGDGSWGLRNLEGGADWAGKVRAMGQFCFAMEIRGLAKHLLGNEEYSPERKANPC